MTWLLSTHRAVKKHDLEKVVGASLGFSRLCFVSVVFAKLYYLCHNTYTA